MKGYPKGKTILKEDPNGYYIYGQNIKRQYEHKMLLDNSYLHVVDSNYPLLAYSSSVGEIGMIDENFYRSGDNGAFQGLFPKNKKMNRYITQYILACLKKQFNNFGYSTSMSNIIDLTFDLPIRLTSDNTPVIDLNKQYHPEGYVPDWEYMEKYIRAIEKLIIKDVVKYKDEMIQKMKEITEWR